MDYVIVQLAEKNVDVAIFSYSANKVSIKGSESFELSFEQDLLKVATTIASGLSSTQKMILCIPSNQLAQRFISLPLSDLRKVREVLPIHMQGEITSQIEEMIFDVLSVSKGTFLAVWAKRLYLSGLLELFISAGCEPSQITSIPFAWSKLPGVGENDALFDGTTLCTLCEGRVSSVTTFSGESVKKQLFTYMAALDLSDSVLPRRLVLFGTAFEQSFEDSALSLPVVKLQLPDELGGVFKNEETFQKLVGIYAVSRACHEGEMVNFRRGELAYTKGDAQLHKKAITTIVLLAVFLVLLFGTKIMQYRSANMDIISLNNSISSVYKEVFPGRVKAVDELAEFKGEIKKLSGSGTYRSLLDLFKTISDAKGVTINGLFEAEIDGTSLHLKGDAASTKSVDDFKVALTDLLSSLQLGEAKTRPDGTVVFTLTGAVKEGK